MSELRRAARAVLLLRDALDLDTAQRSAFLDRECEGDAALRVELDALLDRVSTHGGAFDEPALAMAGRLIEGESSHSCITPAASTWVRCARKASG
ncbi:MAG: hypothetical protein ABIP49_06375 [Lysobacterales bacterium]